MTRAWYIAFLLGAVVTLQGCGYHALSFATTITAAQLTVSPNAIVADGNQTAIATVAVSFGGNAWAGYPIQLSASNGLALGMTPENILTDANGIAQVTMSGTQPGTTQITASVLVGNSTISFDEGAPLTLLAEPPTTLALTATSPAIAGQPVAVSVTAKDQNGQVMSGYLGTVSFVTSDPNVTIPPHTFTPADAGQYETQAVFTSTGSITLTASTAGYSDAALDATATVHVKAAPATLLTLSGVPTMLQAGQATGVTIKALDAYGNTATSYSGTVTWTSTDARASLPASGTFNSGSHNFAGGITLATAGVQSITAADAANPNLTASIATTVTPGSLSGTQSSITLTPTSVPSDGNTTAAVSVVVRDAYGNAIPGQSVSLGASGTGTSFIGASGVTDANGSFVSAVKSSVVQTETIIATLASATLSTPLYVACSNISFSPATITIPGTPVSIAVGDLNGDGKPDIVIGGIGGNVYVSLNQGNGAFAAPQAVTNTSGNVVSLAITDYNGDGQADILALTQNQNDLTFLINNGNNTFTLANLATKPSPTFVAAADLNGDNKSDFVITSGASNVVTAYINKGTVSGSYFVALKSYSTATDPLVVSLADVNGDSSLDIVTVNNGETSAKSLSVLTNNGDGSFAAATNYAAADSATVLALADFDGDGHVDAATGASSDAYVLLNNTQGGFSAATAYATQTNPQGMVAADFNGDHKPDVMTSNNGSNSASLLLNIGRGVFAAQQVFPVSTGPAELVAADLNGDGRVDAAVISATGQSVLVLTNTCR